MIFRAPENRHLEIPKVALTPWLLERTRTRGDKPAFIDSTTGRTLTFRAWTDAVPRVAVGLAQHGLRQGDVLAIYSPNLPEYAVAFHAVLLLGGIVTTVSPLFTASELNNQLRDAGARYVITVPPCVDKVKQAVQNTGVDEVFVFGEADGATPFSSLLAAEGHPPHVTVDPHEDVAVLPYSSGTTGLPKGVMLTHHNLVANLVQSAAAFDLTERDTILGVLPFFHIYGMTVIMNLGLYAGATIVTMPRFDLEQCLEVIENYRITVANVVPPIVLAFAKSPVVDKYDVRSLRWLCSGAAPLKAPLATAASARLGCGVLQGYGLTETSPVTHVPRIGAAASDPASIGPPVLDTEAKIVDVSTGAELEPNQEGEICIRGPQVMKGYLNRPEATRAMIDADGWLHTGDIGYANDDGCFFVVDRLKELIKFKGMQVAPAELEAVLLCHPCVADAAVIPLDNEEAGQIPKAFVVLRDRATPDEIMAYVAERVAPYKKVRCLEVIDQIPKSPSGKILRRVLIERELTARQRPDATG